jgi:hypothetical protein
VDRCEFIGRLDKHRTDYEPFAAANLVTWAHSLDTWVTSLVDIGDVVVWWRFAEIGHQMAKKSQFDKFKDAARDIGADDNEANFDAALRKIAKGDPKALDEVAKKLGQKDPSADLRKPRKPG